MKMQIVIDTNILISSLWGGNPGRVIENWRKGSIVILVTSEIINEYFNVLERFDPSEEDIEIITELIANPEKTILLKTKRRINAIKIDPADNKFLEVAIEGEAQYIVSGDKHLLRLREFKNIRIVTAKEFINLL